MTYRQPRHGRHGPVARIRARVARWLDRIGRRYEWDDEWDGVDDDGQPIADVLPPAPDVQVRKDPDGMPAGWAALHEELAGHGERLPDAGERAGMYGGLAPEALDPCICGEINARHCPVHNEEVPGSAPGTSLHGPGYFHDDAPPEVVPAVQLADGSYAGLRGTIRGPLYGTRRWPMPPAADGPTAVDVTGQPRAGAPAWHPQRVALPGWVTDILGAPSVDAWAWGWQQKRRLAIT